MCFKSQYEEEDSTLTIRLVAIDSAQALVSGTIAIVTKSELSFQFQSFYRVDQAITVVLVAIDLATHSHSQDRHVRSLLAAADDDGGGSGDDYDAGGGGSAAGVDGADVQLAKVAAARYEDDAGHGVVSMFDLASDPSTMSPRLRASSTAPAVTGVAGAATAITAAKKMLAMRQRRQLPESLRGHTLSDCLVGASRSHQAYEYHQEFEVEQEFERLLSLRASALAIERERVRQMSMPLSASAREELMRNRGAFGSLYHLQVHVKEAKGLTGSSSKGAKQFCVVHVQENACTFHRHTTRKYDCEIAPQWDEYFELAMMFRGSTTWVRAEVWYQDTRSARAKRPRLVGFTVVQLPTSEGATVSTERWFDLEVDGGAGTAGSILLGITFAPLQNARSIVHFDRQIQVAPSSRAAAADDGVSIDRLFRLKSADIDETRWQHDLAPHYAIPDAELAELEPGFSEAAGNRRAKLANAALLKLFQHSFTDVVERSLNSSSSSSLRQQQQQHVHHPHHHQHQHYRHRANAYAQPPLSMPAGAERLDPVDYSRLTWSIAHVVDDLHCAQFRGARPIPRCSNGLIAETARSTPLSKNEVTFRALDADRQRRAAAYWRNWRAHFEQAMVPDRGWADARRRVREFEESTQLAAERTNSPLHVGSLQLRTADIHAIVAESNGSGITDRRRRRRRQSALARSSASAAQQQQQQQQRRDHRRAWPVPPHLLFMRRTWVLYALIFLSLLCVPLITNFFSFVTLTILFRLTE
jgi:C2 domain